MKNKKLLAAMLAFALCFGAVGCTASSEADDEPEIAGPITILTPESGEKVDVVNTDVRKFLNNYTEGCSEEYYNDKDNTEPTPVSLNWEDIEGSEEYRILISTSEDMRDPVKLRSIKSETAVYNLRPGVKYYWQVETETEDGTYMSEPAFFTVKNGPYIISAGGVSNMRDFGGSEADGGTVRTDAVYRSASLDDITDSGKTVLLKKLAIKTDLDLRAYGEGNAGYGSPLGEDAKYINISGVEYSEAIDTDAGKSTLAEELRVFADEENYPIVLHCTYGRDRAGTLTFILKALLGVPELELYKDFELSMLSSGAHTKRSVETCIVSLKNLESKIRNYGPDDATLKDCTEAFVKTCGITDEELEQIRSLLLQTE